MSDHDVRNPPDFWTKIPFAWVATAPLIAHSHAEWPEAVEAFAVCRIHDSNMAPVVEIRLDVKDGRLTVTDLTVAAAGTVP